MGVEADKCRERWSSMKMTNELSKTHISVLIDEIEKAIVIHNEEDKGITLTLDENVEMTTRNKIPLIFLTVSGEYFEKRQAISFEEGGWVGFCGWASSTNEKPFVSAFHKWLDIIEENKWN